MQSGYTSEALREEFGGIDEWVFDLDNTLYPRHSDLFAQIDWKMTDYVAELLGSDKDTARKLQKELYREYGTTLRGLMERYEIDPHDFLDKVHDIDYSPVDPNPALGELIAALPGRKHIFTNGDVPHAERTMERLGITRHFHRIFDIVAADLEPKPAEGPYRKFLADHEVHPERAAMFEDMPRNLDVPSALGMKTVLILPAKGSQFSAESWEHAVENDAAVNFATDNLDTFLADVVEAIA
ncbi:pyrimidine 5'-nucleotidase [Ahrensia sp. R2A130]|uniref:pyrimidine 5'-nucleotidase n=1 Tax=Ahrensia sp. R2A130 TaxID=744979 RepID=UPI0001E0E889|nr:pyrimidine 5'-nucleotidase [Ahrensia sp. R2A130]EFL89865.1 pyrimidine 5'-nucleotidase [Ahrensia sp. R2A130]